jgi:hypothetical protein
MRPTLQMLQGMGKGPTFLGMCSAEAVIRPPAAGRRAEVAHHDEVAVSGGSLPKNFPVGGCDNPLRKIPYYRLNQSTFFD